MGRDPQIAYYITDINTRHISIRYYWIKQHVDSGDVVVEKLATEEMPANILTKPLQGAQFRYERKLLTNWED